MDYEKIIADHYDTVAREYDGVRALYLVLEVNPMKCKFCDLSEDDMKEIVFSSRHWTVFLSKHQLYLGRSVVSLRRHSESLSNLTTLEWADLHTVVHRIESVYTITLGATMFNWSCLINNAYKQELPIPHVHFHVRPRYVTAPSVGNDSFPDPNFGHHYQNHSEREITRTARETLRSMLLENLTKI